MDTITTLEAIVLIIISAMALYGIKSLIVNIIRTYKKIQPVALLSPKEWFPVINESGGTDWYGFGKLTAPASSMDIYKVLKRQGRSLATLEELLKFQKVHNRRGWYWERIMGYDPCNGYSTPFTTILYTGMVYNFYDIQCTHEDKWNCWVTPLIRR